MADEKSNDGALMVAENADIGLVGNPRVVRVAAVDWRMQPGGYWVVGGQMDSGKTDLLQTVAGLQPPARGTVRLLGCDLAELSEPELLKQRTRVGFVFKGGGRMFAEMTVAENVALPLRYHRDLQEDEALDAVHALLHLTDLDDTGPERPERLAESMRQRVGLARALALKPDLLFLDEPLAGLAWRHRQWWLDFMQALANGIPQMDGKKIGIAVTTNDFAPWQGRKVSFALIRDRRWQALGEQKELPTL